MGAKGEDVENFCDAGFDFWEGQDGCNNKLELLEKYGDRMGQVSMFMPPPQVSDEEMVKQIKERVYEWGKNGRYITWFADGNPNRLVDGAELIYKISREFYANK